MWCVSFWYVKVWVGWGAGVGWVGGGGGGPCTPGSPREGGRGRGHMGGGWVAGRWAPLFVGCSTGALPRRPAPSNLSCRPCRTPPDLYRIDRAYAWVDGVGGVGAGGVGDGGDLWGGGEAEPAAKVECTGCEGCGWLTRGRSVAAVGTMRGMECLRPRTQRTACLPLVSSRTLSGLFCFPVILGAAGACAPPLHGSPGWSSRR